MDDVTREELIAKGTAWFTIRKSVWSEQEIADIYRLYNACTGESKKDTRCPSCRRNTITALRNIWAAEMKVGKE